MAPDRSLRWMPAVVGVTVAAATLALALYRDLGVFLATVFLYVPALLSVAVGITVWGAVEKRSGRKRSIFLTVAAIAVSAPTIYVIGNIYRDQIVFAFWWPTHAALTRHFENRDGIVSYWGGWGFAGVENDIYLVAHHGSTLSSDNQATQWIEHRGGKCEIVKVQHMSRAFYILTTYNCTLDQ